jgi:phage terminase large subunit
MGRAIDLPLAEVFEPLLRPSRYKGLFGGRGGMKSHAFAELLVDRCMTDKEPVRAVCVREIQLSLKQSVKLLIEDKIKKHDLGGYFRCMDTEIKTPNDGIVIFQGMHSQTAESIKSLEGFNIAWIEEAQSLSQRSLELLRPTIRVPGSEIWASWNPRFPTDPVDNFFRGNGPRTEKQGPWELPPDSIIIESSWEDNPWFPDVLRQEMEWDRRTDLDKYLHIWGGGYEMHSEARVFKNWRVEDFEIPSDAVLRQGGDWGFSVDPTVLVRMFERTPPAPARKQLFICDEVYKVGCEIDDTPMLFDRLGCREEITPDMIPRIKSGEVELLNRLRAQGYESARAWPTIADSARPETISYLKRHGYPRIEPAVKGANSVEEGIKFLQGYDIIIHSRCKHTKDEFTHFCYKTDPQTGEILPILMDKKNHVIDSARYGIEPIRGNTRSVARAVWG